MNKVIGALRVLRVIEAEEEISMTKVNMIIGEREANKNFLVLREIRVNKVIGVLLVQKAIEGRLELRASHSSQKLEIRWQVS